MNNACPSTISASVMMEIMLKIRMKVVQQRYSFYNPKQKFLSEHSLYNYGCLSGITKFIESGMYSYDHHIAVYKCKNAHRCSNIITTSNYSNLGAHGNVQLFLQSTLVTYRNTQECRIVATAAHLSRIKTHKSVELWLPQRTYQIQKHAGMYNYCYHNALGTYRNTQGRTVVATTTH